MWQQPTTDPSTHSPGTSQRPEQATKCFRLPTGTFRIPYRLLCTIELYTEPGYEDLMLQLEQQLLREHPGFRRFHTETINDIPCSRIRWHYALPEDVEWVSNDS